MRKTIFAEGEFYHIFNRGVDKRVIFLDQEDIDRFFQDMRLFNTIDPIGSVYELTLNRGESFVNLGPKLVNFCAYCLNPNHYHFILEQISENGIEKFMHKIGTGYTMYFNRKYKRTGALFQGRYKSVHVSTNEQLLHLSAYVNLNYKVHKLDNNKDLSEKFFRSSWNEYYYGEKGIRIKNEDMFCKNDIVLGQFQDQNDYKVFAENSLNNILENKKKLKELEELNFGG